MDEILPIRKFLLVFFLVFNIKKCCRLCKKCITYQNQGYLTLKTKTDLHGVYVSNGVDNCNLPEIDGYCCLVVCIDYFSKWSEAKPFKDKRAATVSQFLYELIHRYT